DHGRSHRYHPLITKGKYQQKLMRNVLDNVFSGSLTGMVSSLISQESVSGDELDALKRLIEDSDER
ncbi:MAG: BlaI/MecI/CopY family transcriptional regulator, partial [Bacteroidota bacterium]